MFPSSSLGTLLIERVLSISPEPPLSNGYAMSRTIAIGDIHGCGDALRAILAAIDPQPDDTIIGMGDYVDRGPGSRDVIEQLLALAKRCQFIAAARES